MTLASPLESPLLVDPRDGSGYLVTPLSRLGLTVKSTKLDAGDVAFCGLGPEDELVNVGIELKTVREMIDDLISPRFSGSQLLKLMKGYDYQYLLVTGAHRANQYTGYLEVPGKPKGKGRSPWSALAIGRNKAHYQTLYRHLYSISIKTGLPIIAAHTKTDIYQQIATLYRWWSKGWKRHDSHQRYYVAPDPRRKIERLTAPTKVERIAKELPVVGHVRAEAVAKKFKTLKALFDATLEDWASIDGIGTKGAQKILRFLHEE